LNNLKSFGSAWRKISKCTKKQSDRKAKVYYTIQPFKVQIEYDRIIIIVYYFNQMFIIYVLTVYEIFILYGSNLSSHISLELTLFPHSLHHYYDIFIDIDTNVVYVGLIIPFGNKNSSIRTYWKMVISILIFLLLQILIKYLL